jgi:hypothetical protein
MPRTYNNVITANEVSIAIERFLIAPYPQAFTPGRIDLASLPSGFIDLGAVVEDTPEVTVTREFYKLETGIPKVEQYRTLVGVSGKVSFSLWSNSFQKVQYALGNLWWKTATATLSVINTTVINSGAVLSQYIGTKNTAYFALLGVADFLNGVQVIHEFGKACPTDEWKETFRPNQAGQVPLTFDLMGYDVTLGATCSELVIGIRHYINGDGVTCVTT